MFSTKLKAAVGLLLSLVLAGSFFLIPTSTANAGSGNNGATISRIGERAFEDLATCLASYKTPVLDVFYLVDNSGSLEYTDPKYVRSEVLGSSVKELESFKNQGIEVNYAAQLFASDIEKVQSWSVLKEKSDFENASNNLVKKIKKNFAGFTDWEQGLSYAYKQLSSRPANHCKMLIWFTDGGINPDGDLNHALNSLRALCNTSLSSNSLGSNSGPFGLMAKIRKAGISLFGVLYQNDASTLKAFKEDPDIPDPEARLQSEHNRMEYMAPLIEGVGSITTEDPYGVIPSGGKVQCGPLDEAGFAPSGQPNGAFIRAQDPVDLAFQFLSMQAVLAGGSGRPIIDGKFNVPAGTAAFRVLTNSEKWTLTGPENSGVKITSTGKQNDPHFAASSTAGVHQLEFTALGAKKYQGTWKFEDGDGNSALFLFSGLTVQLDRDQQSQIVSDRENSLTGRIVRKPEYASMPVNLAVYGSQKLTLSQPDTGGNLKEITGLDTKVETNGQFKVDGLKPDSSTSSMDLWVNLSLGDEFDPVTANFGVDVVSKQDLTTAKANLVTLTTLEGPTGKASGTLTLVGPTSQDSSEFCIEDPAVRTDDAQTSAQKHPRDESFIWTFDGKLLNGEAFCVTLARGETKDVAVQVTNATQANSHVVSIRNTSSTSAGASLSETVQFEFKSVTQTNTAVEFWVFALLLLLGFLLPLLLLYGMNWITTKFLPLEQTVRAEYPVKILTGGTAKIVDKDGNPIKVEANDFKFLPDGPAARVLGIGSHGNAQAKMAAFPLLPSWFQQSATPGNRVISIYSESGKNPSHFKNGLATEISPNHAANWFLSIPEGEFAKASGEAMNATLIVAARMGNLPQYQSRVQEISLKPGLQGRLDEVRAAIVAETDKNAGKSPRNGKGTKAAMAQDSGSIPVASPTNIPGAASVPGVPTPAVPTTPGSTPGQPSAPSIPGVPGIPGASGAGPIPGVPGNPSVQTPTNIPGAPKNIPGINPPN